MSLFEDLCKKYNDKCIRDIDFARTAGIRAAQFVDSFQKYIQAPEFYPVTDNSGKMNQEKYIKLVFVDINGKETGKNYRSVSEMRFDSKGFLRFCISVVLESEPRSYPKEGYQIDCGIRPLNDTQCRVFVGRPEDSISKEFIWTFDPELSDLGPLQYIVDLITQQLDRQPFLNAPLAE